ncbi:MAG TPA: class I SAM-dependent methyltransferase [Planctomycetota bacterium]|nr:class I SAM-dependent methyltransferase [Planctomycetota bacterium]
MTCRICGNARDNTTCSVREMMYGTRETFAYVQCAACGCIQIAEIPDDMTPYYPPDYQGFKASRRDKIRRSVNHPLKRWRYRYAVLNEGLLGRLLYAVSPAAKLRWLSYAGLTRGSRVLDVGCGAGSLLFKLREIGMTRLLGVDPYIEADIDWGNGLVIRKQRLEDVEGTWDCILFNHSLEHMPDQHGTIALAEKRLAPDGVLVVLTPVVDGDGWKRYGVNWVGLDAPRHLYVHSHESLARLLGAAGLGITRVRCNTTAFNLWASEQYARDIPLHSPRSWAMDHEGSVFSQADMEAFKKRARRLNAEGRGDQAIFYARRTSP